MAAKKRTAATMDFDAAALAELGMDVATVEEFAKKDLALPVTAYEPVERFPSGSLYFDWVLGGGVPCGRVMTITGESSYGKTTTTLLMAASIIKNADQMRNGGRVAFFDSENTYDPRWSEKLGIDPKRIHLYQPESGEQMLDTITAHVHRKTYDLIVVDSVAETAFDAEYEGSMEDSHVGVAARKWSQFLRIIKKPLARSGTALVLINQITMKIGVMYGCFPYQSGVLLADGSTMTIGEIVNQKKQVDVLSWNETAGRFEAKPVINWFKNGVPVDEFAATDNKVGTMEQEYITLHTEYPRGGGYKDGARITCTPNHLIATPDGFRHAMDIDLGDQVLNTYDDVILSSDLHQLVIGSMLGDGSVRHVSGLTAYYREEHAAEQYDYIVWKHQAFGDLAGDIRVTERRVGFSTKHLHTFSQIRHMFYRSGESVGTPKYKHITEAVLNLMTPLSLAVWYQDDGSLSKQDMGNPNIRNRRQNKISLHQTTPEEREMIARVFAERFGLRPKLSCYGNVTYIFFNGDDADRFEEIVAPYMHPSMSYKLRNPNRIGECLPMLDMSYRIERVALPCRVIEISRRIRQGKDSVRYNLQVADNATYIIGDTIVHNSPETEYGGRRIPYAASIRVKMLQPRQEEGAMVFRPKTVKNKTAPNGREAEVALLTKAAKPFVDIVPELTGVGKDLSVFTKEDGSPISGNCGWFFSGEKVGNGETGAKTMLYTNRELRVAVEQKVREAIANLNRAPIEQIGLDPETGAFEDEPEEYHSGSE